MTDDDGRIAELRRRVGHLREPDRTWTDELTVFEAMEHDPTGPPSFEDIMKRPIPKLQAALVGDEFVHITEVEGWWADRAVASAIAYAERSADPLIRVRLPRTCAERYHWWARELDARAAQIATIEPVSLFASQAAWDRGPLYSHNAPDGPVAEYVEWIIGRATQRRYGGPGRVGPDPEKVNRLLEQRFDMTAVRRGLRARSDMITHEAGYDILRLPSPADIIRAFLAEDDD